MREVVSAFEAFARGACGELAAAFPGAGEGVAFASAVRRGSVGAEGAEICAVSLAHRPGELHIAMTSRADGKVFAVPRIPVFGVTGSWHVEPTPECAFWCRAGGGR